MWHTSILIGGVGGPISWGWRNERCRATLSYLQRRRIFRIDDGISGMRILRYRGSMDTFLHSEHFL